MNSDEVLDWIHFANTCGNIPFILANDLVLGFLQFLAT